ncbi:hypothetical protein DFH06DRAFT_1220311, partial [Mycena polygramma]
RTPLLLWLLRSFRYSRLGARRLTPHRQHPAVYPRRPHPVPPSRPRDLRFHPPSSPPNPQPPQVQALMLANLQWAQS